MIAFASQLLTPDEQRRRDAQNYALRVHPFRNPDPPNVRYRALHDLRKCVTHGCPVHVAMVEICGDCHCATVPLRAWRKAVDAGEIVR